MIGLYGVAVSFVGGSSVLKSLVFGTKTEVWDYLHAFREGILLSQGR